MREKDEIFSINAFILMTKCKFYKELVWHPTPVCLENPMEGGAWKAAVHGVTEGRTRLSDFTFWRLKLQDQYLSAGLISSKGCEGRRKAPPSMGFSRQEYWSGLPLPSP